MKNALLQSLTEVQIPFNGFYYSIHSQLIDSEVEREIEYLEEKGIPQELFKSRQNDLACYGYDWKETQVNYLKKYFRLWEKKLEDEIYSVQKCNAVNTETIDFQFDIKSFEMASPKYYNFSTDRIFIKCSTLSLLRLLKLTRNDVQKWSEFNKKAVEMFKSRDGFISSYDYDIAAWGNPTAWDHNHWHCLLQVWAPDEELYVEEFDLVVSDKGKEIFAAIDRREEQREKDQKALSEWNTLCANGTF